MKSTRESRESKKKKRRSPSYTGAAKIKRKVVFFSFGQEMNGIDAYSLTDVCSKCVCTTVSYSVTPHDCDETRLVHG